MNNIPDAPQTPYTVFLSDIHLTPQRPDISAGFARLMCSTLIQNADAIYILGDLADAWIGDDTPLNGVEGAFNALEQLKHHPAPVYFQHGNRDFLIGDDFAQKYGITLLDEAVVIDLYGTPTLLIHGDTLCTDDIEYQAFRKMVRNPQWIQSVLSKPLAERIELAKSIRGQTTQATQEKALEIMDVNEDAVTSTFDEFNVPVMIHGHTHRPAIHAPTPNHTRIVLSDWDKQGHCLIVSKTDLGNDYAMTYFDLEQSPEK